MWKHLRWLFVAILLIVGLALVLIEPIKTALVTGYHPNITAQIVQKNQEQKATYNMDKVKAVTAGQIFNARLHAKDIHPVGQIVMPKVDLHLPITLGVNNENLMLAAGTMRPGQKMGRGNYALAGHHMINKQALFSPLYIKAKLGMMVYLTDMQKVYQYQINVRKIISPYDIGVIDDTKQSKITLITCNDSGSKRLLIQGNLVKMMALKQAPQSVLKAMQATTNNHDVLKGY